MGQFVPKFIAPETWEQMPANTPFALRMSLDEPVRFRFGMGIGFYIEVSKTGQGFVINSLDFESGEQTLIGKLNADATVILGRSSECQIKISQPIMSRQHMELKLWNEHIVVAKDLGSTNGTYMWKEIPIINLALPAEEQQSSDVLANKFGNDVTSLLNEYQTKGS